VPRRTARLISTTLGHGQDDTYAATLVLLRPPAVLLIVAVVALVVAAAVVLRPAPDPDPPPRAVRAAPAATATVEPPSVTAAAAPPLRVRRARCPAGLDGCRVATGRVIYVEAVDPDGDGDAHYVLSGGNITGPGLSVIDVAPDLRPRRLPASATR